MGEGDRNSNQDRPGFLSLPTGPLREVAAALTEGVELYVAAPRELDRAYFPPPGAPRPEPTLREILALLKYLHGQGYRSLLLGGPEPFARPDIGAIVLAAGKLGFSHVFAETSGANFPADPAQFKKLLAGIDHVFLRRFSGERARFAQLTGNAQAFDACEGAPERLQAAGIAHSIVYFVHDTDLDWLAADMEQLHARGEQDFVLSMPLGGVERDGEREFPNLHRIREALIPYKYAWPNTPYRVSLFRFPLCALSFGERIRLGMLPTPPGMNLLSAADERPNVGFFSPDGRMPCKCRYHAVCPRVHKHYADSGLLPEDLSIGTDYLQGSDDYSPHIIIRPLFECNQNCSFCFADHDVAAPSLAELQHRLKTLRPRAVTISGGEPGLLPDLPGLVQTCREVGVTNIILQTNAVVFSSRRKADDIREAGVHQAFVSLHGHSPQKSDALTRLPGSFEKTLQGIDNLVNLPFGVVVNHVVQQANYRDVPDFIRFIIERFPAYRKGRLRLNLAFVFFVGIIDEEQMRRFIPRLSDVAPHIIEGLEIAQAADLEIDGLDTQCGFPRCILGCDSRYFRETVAPPDAPDFVKALACKACAYTSSCVGLRQNYAQLYGTDELSPIRSKS